MSIQPADCAAYIYHAWNDALANNDITAILRLYAADATVESPLISYLLGISKGICQGHAQLYELLKLVAQRKPKERQYYRQPYFTDGTTLLWEYPRLTPQGEQMDFIEVMELKDCLIHYHRVYWGWYGVNILQTKRYYRS